MFFAIRQTLSYSNRNICSLISTVFENFFQKLSSPRLRPLAVYHHHTVQLLNVLKDSSSQNFEDSAVIIKEATKQEHSEPLSEV